MVPSSSLVVSGSVVDDEVDVSLAAPVDVEESDVALELSPQATQVRSATSASTFESLLWMRIFVNDNRSFGIVPLPSV